MRSMMSLAGYISRTWQSDESDESYKVTKLQGHIMNMEKKIEEISPN